MAEQGCTRLVVYPNPGLYKKGVQADYTKPFGWFLGVDGGSVWFAYSSDGSVGKSSPHLVRVGPHTP